VNPGIDAWTNPAINRMLDRTGHNDRLHATIRA